MRSLTADEPGIAALRHQRDAVFARKLANRRNFRRRSRPQDKRRAPVKQVALFGQIWRDLGRIGHSIFVADDLAELRDQFGRERRGCRLHDIDVCLLLAHCRSTAARRRRSLIASPRP